MIQNLHNYYKIFEILETKFRFFFSLICFAWTKFWYIVGMIQYLTNPTWKLTLDEMQMRMQCCGIESFKDWYKTAWMHHDVLDENSPVILEYASNMFIFSKNSLSLISEYWRQGFRKKVLTNLSFDG